MGDANQPWRRLERPDEGLRPRGWPLPGPVDRRYAQSFYDHVERNADPGDRVWLQERRGLHRARPRWHDPRPHTPPQPPPHAPPPPPPPQAHPCYPPPDKRTLALPGPIGGLQTGCANDGKRVYTNGIDAIGLGTQESGTTSFPPTGGRAVAISLDTKTEYWRHDRPKMATVGGPPPK